MNDNHHDDRELPKGGGMRKLLLVVVMAWTFQALIGGGFQADSARAAASSEKAYVGAERCGECHLAQYQSFKSNSKKAHSFGSVRMMKRGLTAEEVSECYGCHTTGYGKPGGFRSEAETPHLADAGCEVCHGPGNVHAETGDPADIKSKLTVQDCAACHSSQRVQSFKFKPMIYGGGH
jgi:hypothetical protein